jgi:hypothetical protein
LRQGKSAFLSLTQEKEMRIKYLRETYSSKAKTTASDRPGCLTEKRETLPPAYLGRGHRPCHSATLTLGPPGAQSPRPAPAPPPAGASRPPGRALACCCAWTCRSTGNRSARAGETQCVS